MTGSDIRNRMNLNEIRRDEKITLDRVFLILMLNLSVSAAYAADEPWFRFENGRPIYVRSYEPGLDPDYGKVGKRGLVWYAAFDGDLKSYGINPDNRSDVLKIDGVVEGGTSDHLSFVPGLRGQALTVKEDINAGVLFKGLEKITASTQGTIVVWMHTKDASISGYNSFFETGQINLVTWMPGAAAIQGLGPSHQSLSASFTNACNDVKGWNMYAATWSDDFYQIYVNGIPVHQGKGNKIPGIPYLMLRSISSSPKGLANRHTYDEAAIYNRQLSVGELRKQFLSILNPITDQRISIPHVKAEVAIDGKINDAEWGGAARVTGMLEGTPTGEVGSGQLADPQNSFHVQFDDKYLHIAVRSPYPDAILQSRQLTVALSGALKTVASVRDAVDPSVEDVFEFLISPLDKDGSPTKVYCLMVNGRNQVTDGTWSSSALPAGTLDKSWNANWRAATKEYDNEWVCEAAIPWADLGIIPSAGQAVGFNVARTWRLLKDGMDEWAWGRRPTVVLTPDPATNYRTVFDVAEHIPLGTLILGAADTPIMQVERLGDLLEGRGDFRAVVRNPCTHTTNVQILLTTNTGLELERRSVGIEADKTAVVESVRIMDKGGDAALALELRDAKQQITARNEWNFIRDHAFEVTLRRLPSAGKIVVKLNCASLAPMDAKTLHAEIVVRNSSGKTLKTVKSDKFQSYCKAVDVVTDDLAVGDYFLDVVIMSAGKPAAEAKGIPYSKKPLPEWWDNDIGKEEGTPYVGVPYPWTAMKAAGDVVQCWGREYQFGRRLLPVQIANEGAHASEMLRAPMRLTVKSADGETLDSATADAETKWTKQSSIRVEGVRSIAGKDFSVRNDLWAEYDGLLWCRLTIQPKNKITLSSMELEIPLTKEFTDVINAYDYGLTRTGKLPKDGLVCSNRPIWLGNGDGGIQWLCETDGWFFQKDNQKMMNVEMHPEGVSLRVVMIDVPTEFEEPHTVEFGFIATPVRPRKYRTWQDPQQWGFRGGPGGWYPKGQEFLPAPEFYPGLKCGYTGGLDQPNEWSPIIPMSLGCIYVTTGCINSNTEDFEDFGDEWLADDNTAPAVLVTTTHASKSYRDWFVWRHWRAMQNIPHQGLYYDAAAENPSSNLHAGAGYVRRDGSVATTYPILGARDICKRLYNMIIKYYPFVWVGFHQSGMPNMAYEGFGTWSWDGENFNSIINDKQPTYLGVLTPAKFRAEYMGHNMGWPVMFLGQGRIRKEWADAAGCENVIDHLHGLCLLHDVPAVGWQIEGEREKVCERTYRAVERHRLSSPAYRFVPYWRQDIVQLPRPEIHASFYILQEPWKIEKGRDWAFYAEKQDTPVPKKAVMIVYNDSDFKGEMHLNPDWKKMGFDSTDGLLVENAVHSTGFRIEKARNDKGEEVDKAVFFPRPDETARIENGGIAFPMTPFNYRMIVFTQYK